MCRLATVLVPQVWISFLGTPAAVGNMGVASATTSVQGIWERVLADVSTSALTQPQPQPPPQPYIRPPHLTSHSGATRCPPNWTTTPRISCTQANEIPCSALRFPQYVYRNNARRGRTTEVTRTDRLHVAVHRVLTSTAGISAASVCKPRAWLVICFSWSRQVMSAMSTHPFSTGDLFDDPQLY